MAASSCGTEAAYTGGLVQACSVAVPVPSWLRPCSGARPDHAVAGWSCVQRSGVSLSMGDELRASAMRFYWYWPHPHASASPLATAMLRPGDELVVQALPSLRGTSFQQVAEYEVVRDL